MKKNIKKSNSSTRPTRITNNQININRWLADDINESD